MFASEIERRRFAVGLVVEEGVSQVEAAQRVDRSERWLRKWLRRYEALGDDGLRELSRAPRVSPTGTPDRTRIEVLRVRRELEAHEFANRGAEAIRHDLWERGWSPLPSVTTIERILRSAGMVSRPKRRRRSNQSRFDDIRQPGIYQQIDWVGPRWVGDGQRFSMINTVDIGGGGADIENHRRQLMVNAVESLIASTWPRLSIPLAQSADNQFAWTSRPDDPWTLWVRVCLLLGVEAILTPPGEFGWHNHIEGFNGILQARTLERHHYPTIEDFTASKNRFLAYWHHQRAHPRLTVVAHGTRHPGELLDKTRPTLRHLPAGFTLDDYRDHTNQIRLPLAKGRVTFLRRVQPGNTINIAANQWPLLTPTTLEGEIVVATILTSTRQLAIRHDGEVITRHRYPIPDTPINPHHPIAPSGLYYHRTGTMS